MMKKLYSMGLWDMQTIIHYSLLIIFLVGGLATITYYGYNDQGLAGGNIKDTLTTTTTTTTTDIDAQVFDHETSLKIGPQWGTCDLFSGRWIYDNSSRYPLYEDHQCPYLEETFACQTYGRKDSKYLQWRWQPNGCNFPTFNGKAVVERLRGKRMLFVGDSLNRNQWMSMMCMLHSLIPGVKQFGLELDGILHTFRATDYNISIDFYWAPMLVESNGDSPTDHHRNDRMFRINAIEKHARHWVDTDILIFNSYHWWRLPVIKLLPKAGSLLDTPNQVYEEVNYLRAYKMGLKTWSKWARTHIDHTKTKLFFMGATATHMAAREWGGENLATCYGETEPETNSTLVGYGIDRKMLSILESTLKKLEAKGLNVQLINITQLTQYRKDGHTSIYKKKWRPLTELETKRPENAADCSHWCLPGVPDIWNELLLAYILQ